MSVIVWAIIGYLLGSVPFGIVITRALGLGDLRQIGSGNIGATNVLRTGNKPAALATLLLDTFKGAIAVILARHFGGDLAAQTAALASFAGHCFPIWLGFKGGKGVATFLGTVLALAWPAFLLTGATWLVVAGIGRRSSLAGLICAASAPIWMWAIGAPYAITTTFMAVLIFYRHKENITRLLDGSEPKIGKK